MQVRSLVSSLGRKFVRATRLRMRATAFPRCKLQRVRVGAKSAPACSLEAKFHSSAYCTNLVRSLARSLARKSNCRKPQLCLHTTSELLRPLNCAHACKYDQTNTTAQRLQHTQTHTRISPRADTCDTIAAEWAWQARKRRRKRTEKP